MDKARTSLLLDYPFFGALLFRLKGQESRAVQTMATDGTSLLYNPDFVDTLSAATLAGVLAHEVMHPALAHHTRRCGRSPKRWNEACDYAINPILLDAGLQLPAGVLNDERFRGLSAEEIYNRLLADEQLSQAATEKVGSGEQSDQSGTSSAPADGLAPTSTDGIGQVLDAPNSGGSTSEDSSQEREWTIAVNQAASVASRAGRLPAGIKRALQGNTAARVDWRELLRRAWSEAAPGLRLDSSKPPSHLERSLSSRRDKRQCRRGRDCSRLLRLRNERQLRLFEAEVRSIVEGQRPQLVFVMYFDTRVQDFQTIRPGERIELKPVGGGGTDFRACFDCLSERQIAPKTLVVLTDLYGRFPEVAPSFPVLWASTGRTQAPFGLVVPM